MRVEVSPRWAEIQPEQPVQLVVSVSNASTVIGGYAVRVLGADPDWVSTDTDQLSLFPDETRTILVTLRLPSGMPAGVRRIAIQVRELAPPFASSVTEVDLSVPEVESMQVRVDPLTVTAGKRATFGVVVTNTGNTVLHRTPAGDDPENRVAVSFTPATVDLAPGQHAVVDLRARARRPFVGSPAVRVLSVYLDPTPAATEAVSSAPAGRRGGARARDERTAAANATLIQRPVLSRGALALFGLLAAATVFAVVITAALGQLVTQSAADRDLALQVAAARDQAAATGSGGLGGTVKTLTGQNPVPGVTVELFAADSTTTPAASTSTDDAGAFSFADLAAGDYKLSFRGAGFVQLWYPAAATDTDAQVITLKEGQQVKGLAVAIGGVPASVAGKVVGDDVSVATLYLKTLPAGTAAGTVQGAAGTVQGASTGQGTGQGAVTGQGTAGAQGAATSSGTDTGAIVRTVPIGADGAFTLPDVPSPSTYQLVVSKPGYATTTQLIDVQAGQVRTGLQLRLVKGDGSITGHVNNLTERLGEVSLTASSGQASASTVSLTTGDKGAFTLRGLPTPGTYTVVASATGYTSQTQTVTLAAGQQLTDLEITLVTSVGSLSGQVQVAVAGQADPTPARGVSVTVTDGSRTVQTVTASQKSTGADQVSPGDWTVSGLPVPGTYTVTFSRTDLAPQTVGVQLAADGSAAPGSGSGSLGLVTMQSATATVYGTVSQTTAKNTVGEVVVTLRSATETFTTRTASVGGRGRYQLDRIPPGTYTVTASYRSGTSPSSDVITLAAGDRREKNFTLKSPATLLGTVVGTDGKTPRVGWTVTLYLVSTYPDDPVGTRTTGPTGGFTFSDIDAGQYVVQVRAPGTGPVASVNVLVEPSQRKPVTIEADGG